VTTLVSFILVAGSAYGLGWSNLLIVKKISYVGVAPGSPQALQISAAVERTGLNPIKVGDQLARLNLAGTSHKLSAISWIKDEQLNRNWLHGTITVKVSARIPVAKFVDNAGSTKLIDSEGIEFTLPSGDQGSAANLPNISLNYSNTQTRRSAAHFVAAMPAMILESMTSLVVSDAQVVSMTSGLRKPSLLIQWGEVRDLPNKIEVLGRLLSAPENKKISMVDISEVAAPVVK